MLHHHHFERTIARRMRVARQPALFGFAVAHSPIPDRPSRTSRPLRPARRHRLPPTRAARPSRSRGVFLTPRRGMLSAVLLGLLALTLATLLGTANVVGSHTLAANPGPQLFASTSIVPSELAEVRF